MAEIVLFDEARCTNCHLCEMYCSLAFSPPQSPPKGGKIASPPLAGEPASSPSPGGKEGGQRVYEFRPSIARIRVVENEDDTRYVAHVCFHCEEPACVAACPSGAIRKDPATGLVTIDAGECTGCEMCVDACEYHCIFLVGGHAVKCEVCFDPLCVKACAVKALTLGEPDAAYRERTGQLYTEVWR